MNITVSVEGIAEAARRFRKLGANIQRKAVRASIRAAGKPVVRIARQYAPSDTGTLAKSIRVLSVRNRRGEITGTVGSKGTKGLARGNSRFYGSKKVGRLRYIHLVVGGTRPHAITPRAARALAVEGRAIELVQHPGARPNPFIARAAQASFRPAVAEFSKDFGPRVEREARTL